MAQYIICCSKNIKHFHYYHDYFDKTHHYLTNNDISKLKTIENIDYYIFY